MYLPIPSEGRRRVGEVRGISVWAAYGVALRMQGVLRPLHFPSRSDKIECNQLHTSPERRTEKPRMSGFSWKGCVSETSD